MNSEIQQYNNQQSEEDMLICNKLSEIIESCLTESVSKIWHAHPVWFIDDNPIVGYSKQKKGIRLMFWSGADFNEDLLSVRGDKFKDASVFFNQVSEIDEEAVRLCLEKSKDIQWDYKNIVKRKGVLERLK